MPSFLQWLSDESLWPCLNNNKKPFLCLTLINLTYIKWIWQFIPRTFVRFTSFKRILVDTCLQLLPHSRLTKKTNPDLENFYVDKSLVEMPHALIHTDAPKCHSSLSPWNSTNMWKRIFFKLWPDVVQISFLQARIFFSKAAKRLPVSVVHGRTVGHGQNLWFW